jgi:hypothetical protein
MHRRRDVALRFGDQLALEHVLPDQHDWPRRAAHMLLHRHVEQRSGSGSERSGASAAGSLWSSGCTPQCGWRRKIFSKMPMFCLVVGQSLSVVC